LSLFEERDGRVKSRDGFEDSMFEAKAKASIFEAKAKASDHDR